jgi:uncharacterized membrane protein
MHAPFARFSSKLARDVGWHLDCHSRINGLEDQRQEASMKPTAAGGVRIVRDDATSSPWPVNWSAIWVGALAGLVAAVILGLIGLALGAHQAGPGHRIAKWSDVGRFGLIFSVVAAFFAFVIGGWVAGKIAGIRRAETAALHGALAWLVAVPLLLALAALGGTTVLGTWYGGLAGTPVWAAGSTGPLDPQAAAALRNSAVAAASALLLGLMGGVIGGWMTSGERMTIVRQRIHEREAA